MERWIKGFWKGRKPPSALRDKETPSREQEIISVRVNSTLMKQLLCARYGGESKVEKTQTLLSKGLVTSGKNNRAQRSKHPGKTYVEPHHGKLPFIWGSSQDHFVSLSPSSSTLFNLQVQRVNNVAHEICKTPLVFFLLTPSLLPSLLSPINIHATVLEYAFLKSVCIFISVFFNDMGL